MTRFVPEADPDIIKVVYTIHASQVFKDDRERVGQEELKLGYGLKSSVKVVGKKILKLGW